MKTVTKVCLFLVWTTAVLCLGYTQGSLEEEGTQKVINSASLMGCELVASSLEKQLEACQYYFVIKVEKLDECKENLTKYTEGEP